MQSGPPETQDSEKHRPGETRPKGQTALHTHDAALPSAGWGGARLRMILDRAADLKARLMIYWMALFICVLANISANLVFKRVVAQNDFDLSWRGVWALVLDPLLWVGFALCGVILGGYLFAIKVIPAAIAYATSTGLTMAGLTIAGIMAHGQDFQLKSVLGIFLILSGMLLLFRA